MEILIESASPDPLSRSQKTVKEKEVTPMNEKPLKDFPFEPIYGILGEGNGMGNGNPL